MTSVPEIRFDGRAGVAVDLDRLVSSRLLVQANSGGGKSQAIRGLLEQTHGKVQQIILDPEGEFASLREKFGYVLAGEGGDIAANPKTAKVLCRRLLELNASAVLDLYSLKLQERREFVALFLDELMALPRSLWRPLLVVIDEAHVFAPEKGAGEAQSTEAVITLCTQGRKRGYCAVLATQRLSKLHKDAAAELLNKLIGRTGLDVDVKRCGDDLGMGKDERRSLMTLAPGHFFAYGPAISPVVRQVKTAPTATAHPKAGGISAPAPAAPAAIRDLVAQLQDIPQQAAAAVKTEADFRAKIKELEAALRHRTPATVPAESIQAAVEQATFALRGVLVAKAQTMQTLRHELNELSQRCGVVHMELMAAVERAKAVSVPNVIKGADTPARDPQRQQPRAPTETVRWPGISRPQQRMLDAIAEFESVGVTDMAQVHVATFSGQSSKSSGFRANLSQLSAAGLIERRSGGVVRLTDAGRDAAAAPATPLTLAMMHDAWRRQLSGPQVTMLDLLLREFPASIERDALAKSSGQSPLSSGYRANLSTLSSLGLIRRVDRDIVATELLFPEALR